MTMDHHEQDDIERAAIQGEPRLPTAKKSKDQRPVVRVEPTNPEATTDATIAAIAGRDIFQRGGALCGITFDATTSKDGKEIVKAAGTAKIRELPLPRLREIIGSAVRFERQQRRKDEEGETRLKWATTPMPSELGGQVAARGEWQHIRPIVGIAEWPTLRPDGTILSERGYDPQTMLFCESDINVTVADSPTLSDAQQAIATLHDLVCDFPFSEELHRTSWVALLLTLLARPAIDGPTPLVLIDSSRPGSGKGMVADVAALIVTGKPFARETAPTEEAEWRKNLYSTAMCGHPVTMFDNLKRPLKSAALDAVLTSLSVIDRELGGNGKTALPWRSVIIVTANNVSISTDLVRRSIHVRLNPQTESPETRNDFKRPDIIEYTRANRARYIEAGLTILRAYFAAGRPTVTMRAMGSYEAWSSVVRAALIWAGEPDIAAAQDELREMSDFDTETKDNLISAWFEYYGEQPVPASCVVSDMSDAELSGDPTLQTLKEAVSAHFWLKADERLTVPKFSAGLKKLRAYRARGLFFDKTSDKRRAEGMLWRVARAEPEPQ